MPPIGGKPTWNPISNQITLNNQFSDWEIIDQQLSKSIKNCKMITSLHETIEVSEISCVWLIQLCFTVSHLLPQAAPKQQDQEVARPLLVQDAAAARPGPQHDRELAREAV